MTFLHNISQVMEIIFIENEDKNIFIIIFYLS